MNRTEWDWRSHVLVHQSAVPSCAFQEDLLSGSSVDPNAVQRVTLVSIKNRLPCQSYLLRSEAQLGDHRFGLLVPRVLCYSSDEKDPLLSTCAKLA